MAKQTERTRSGGTHYVEPRKRSKREPAVTEYSEREETTDAGESIGNRGGD